MEKISIVVPCYNEEEAMPYFYEEITKVAKEMNKVNFEIIFVNDGSKDKTLEIARELSKKDKRVRYVSFSRNFGKEAAMLAGLDASTGDYVALMDADLQDPPALLEEMYNSIKNEGYDCVASRRVTRKGEPKIRSFFAEMYYKLINKISKTEIVNGARDFRLMTRQMVDSILTLREYNRYSKGIFSWVGYKTKWLEYENIERVAGTTKWNFWKLFGYAIESIIAFSTVPLALPIFFGILFCIASFILLIIIIVKICTDVLLLLLPLYFFLSLSVGIILICLGIVGEYIAKSYLEIKNRPTYIIKETEKDK